MIDFSKELKEILENDPLGLLNIRSTSSSTTENERLILTFKQINDFIKEHGHEPKKSNDINERKLYSRLK